MEKIPEAKKKLFEFVERIHSGKVSRDELTIKQKISRSPNQYKVNSYQAVAARQLERSGVVASAGKNVRYIILMTKRNILNSLKELLRISSLLNSPNLKRF